MQTCYLKLLKLITGIRKGLKAVKIFKRIYAVTDKVIYRNVYRKLIKLRYNNKDFIKFTFNF